MSWLVFVESNTSGTGRLFPRAAQAQRYNPVVLVEDPARYPYLDHDGVPFVITDTSDIETLQRALKELSKDSPVAGIYSSSEYFVETVAKLAALQGLAGPDENAVAQCRDKWQQRCRLRENGVRTPEFWRVESDREVARVLCGVRFPVVVKPTFGSGSVGVKLCKTAVEAREQVKMLLHRRENERGIPVPREVLIEEYLDGPEYSVEMMGLESLGVTRKHLSPKPFFVEIGHDFPAVLAVDDAARVLKVVKEALRTLSLVWGPSHVEVRLTSDGPAVVEINPRLAGGYIPELVRLASGIDPVAETIRLVTGGRAEIRGDLHAYASIRFLMAPGPGIITEFKGVQDAWRVDGVSNVQLYKTVGQALSIHRDFRDRIGHVISQAAFADHAAFIADEAMSRIEVCVDQAGVN